MKTLNQTIVGALCDAAHNNSRVSVQRDDGRVFNGVAEELTMRPTGLVLLLWSKEEGYKSVRADRVSAVAIHPEPVAA